jgi:predicted transcriptional regulator
MRFFVDETFEQALLEGLKAADEGRLTPLEEVEKMIPQWVSESGTEDTDKVRAAIEAGEADISAGRLISQDEAVKRMAR